MELSPVNTISFTQNQTIYLSLLTPQLLRLKPTLLLKCQALIEQWLLKQDVMVKN